MKVYRLSFCKSWSLLIVDFQIPLGNLLQIATLTSNSINSISKEIVLIVWKIHEFWLADYLFNRYFIEQDLRTIETIIFINFRSSRFTNLQSRGTRNFFVKLLLYSIYWVIDASQFRAVVAQFRIETKTYRQTFAYTSFNLKSIVLLIQNSSLSFNKDSTSKRSIDSIISLKNRPFVLDALKNDKFRRNNNSKDDRLF